VCCGVGVTVGIPSVAVVAELTTNHFGDRERLKQMIIASHAAGADYVKLQRREVGTFYTPEQLAAPYTSPFGTTLGEYRTQLELTADDFAFVEDICSTVGIEWFASVLDLPSFAFIRQFSPTMLKLPSTISEHTELLLHVARTFDGSVVLSTGMTGPSHEDFVLGTFDRAEKLYLLQCNSAYPTPAEHCNVAVVRHYHDRGWLASVLAVAAGARMVEKHVKLGATAWAHFNETALDLMDGSFASYVRHIREAELILGDGTKSPTGSENHKYHPHDR
jgi:sialic acid synthase SpsE